MIQITKPSATKSFDKQIDDLKIPPHSIEAEQSVLGGLMLDNEVWDQVIERISEKDFYRYEHRMIFKAMRVLEEKQQPFDVLTTSEILKELNELTNVGGEVYLFELTKNTPSASNVKAYADIVRERSILRQLIGVANEIADKAFHPEGRGSVELLDNAERKVFEIAQNDMRGQGPQPMGNLLAKAMERINYLKENNKEITGLETTFIDLDKMTSGLQEADLIIVAGRPSMGKTTLAINIAENSAINSKEPVLIFSMEMPGDSLAMRMLSSLGQIEQQKIRSGRLDDADWVNIGSALSILSEAQIFIDDTPALTPTELRSRARRLVREKGKLGLIVVDYLQLMQVNGLNDNRVAEISEISRSLKALAKELSVPIIALSQLNRSLEQRADKRPMMSDLRESGAIEQDADLIIFIYRDEVYFPDTRDKNIAEIIIGKHRNGPIGKVRLLFEGKFTRFRNLNERYQGTID